MNPIELEIFRHRFASIAEEMGVALMRSSFSPNIKERRDYSCAIFDAQAKMIAQAAHIPVHLGSTPMSVEAAQQAFEDPPVGAHILLNDPYQGGTHLPDLTLVTPVHDREGVLRFYVANRAHHADVGGISAGSLPLSRTIEEEGFRVGPTLWSDELVSQVMQASRTPDERLGDLSAQLAANHRGAMRLLELWSAEGERVLEAVTALQDYAEQMMRQLLIHAPNGTWSFEDVLDDNGHGQTQLTIACTLTINEDTATIDFSQSCSQTDGPLNVPRAVTCSAVLYAFRCLAPDHVPSNDGLMRPLDVVTVPGTLVDAVYPAAVAAGNVETSQRITDVVLGALAQAMPQRVPAASCGSMNNVLIGGVDERVDPPRPFAYYETIAGGAGAMYNAHGASAIQTHMTNTLNTPVEALELAYPFVIESYGVRHGSGGEGQWRGGDGVRKTYRFLQPAQVTLMTERRTNAPYGLNGGLSGQRGRNTLIRDGEHHPLPAKCTLDVHAGDCICVETPGGGGWGAPTTDK